ncbi:MAG: GspE/PulE family protein [bacterium]
MVVQKERLGDILVSAGIISEEELQQGIDRQQETGDKLGKSLIDLGLISGVELAAALSTQLNIPYVRLTDYELDRELITTIPKNLARNRQIIPIEENEQKLVVAVADPLDIASLDEVEMMTGKDIEPVIAVESEIVEALNEFYGAEDEISGIIEEASQDDVDVMSTTDSDLEDNVEEMAEETPVIKLVNMILLESVKHDASDIHLEPFEHKFMVRLRMDGVLHEMDPPPKEFQSAIISRIKIMADLDIAETRLPQDGRIKIKLAGQQVEYRVSTLPTVWGESVVLRVLSQEDMALDPGVLGMTEDQEETFKELIERPNGIVLNTGPTSSGKTTTLFAGLNYINDPEIKIITMEDPVEYQLPGIMQCQINKKAGFNFVNGMRAMLRQDPDVCLVGEIRDMETAEIAVQAALTGHMVLSTVHTNQAAGAVSRLVNMGIKPFLLTSTIQAVLAQRLVRVICEHCKEVIEPAQEDLEQIGRSLDDVRDIDLYGGRGCSECGGTGYDGRTAIFEMLEMSSRIAELCTEKASASEIHKAALEEGMLSLTEHGWKKVQDGITTVEEIVRVAPSEKEISVDKDDLDFEDELIQYL